MSKYITVFENDVLLLLLSIGLLASVSIIFFLLKAVWKWNKKDRQKKETARRRRVSVKMRQAVLDRDDYTCQICGISKHLFDDVYPGLGDYLLLEIDHIHSVANGGTGSDKDNLQVLCWRCNRKKGKNKTNDEVRSSIDYGLFKR